VTTSVLEVSCEVSGPADGNPVVLLHGFPYSVRAYDEVAGLLAASGLRVVVPHLRGYGPTRFLDGSTVRSGQQAALGNDLREVLDALGIERAVLGGYDWGGRAACVVAALWPERCTGLVTAGGYNIQNIASSGVPATPVLEHTNWYQYYFHTERGRAGLQTNRREIARYLWGLWSPLWRFDEATFDASAHVLDNPDFVDVVIHSYRHRYGAADGDPALDNIEVALAQQPTISVPAISLHGQDSAWPPEDAASDRAHFTGRFREQLLPGIGHNVPQEAAREFAGAILELA
jgi:pimeloyl-ACP methyl ester carboxylesterase